MGNVACKCNEEMSVADQISIQRNKLHGRPLKPRMTFRPRLSWQPLNGAHLSATAAPPAAVQLFEDGDFPAKPGSIGGISGDAANPNIEQYLKDLIADMVEGWTRPSQIIGAHAGPHKLYMAPGEPCLFKNISPRDIEQGCLGDCWLVSAMAAVAEYPGRIKSLFKQDKLAEDGRYDIRLYDPLAEEWRVVTIDDRLPFVQKPGYYGQLAFAKQTKDNEFWTCLLEKAVAKFVGCYAHLDGGFEGGGMELFTGRPSMNVQISLDADPHFAFCLSYGQDQASAQYATVFARRIGQDQGWGYWAFDAAAMIDHQEGLTDDMLWNKLKVFSAKGYSIACGSRQEYQGILAGHAYTVLRFIDVPYEREGKKLTLRLMHVRNPHRTNEWKGRFSDEDPTWLQFSEAMNLCPHILGNKDNGVFWMEFSEFKQGFGDIAVNFYPNSGEGYYQPCYTDVSPSAAAELAKVTFGIVGHEKWTGLPVPK